MIQQTDDRGPMFEVPDLDLIDFDTVDNMIWNWDLINGEIATTGRELELLRHT